MASGEGWLEDVGGVVLSVAHEHVDLVDEQYDECLGLLDLLEDTLESLLEVTLVLGTRSQRSEVETVQLAALQDGGDVVVDDSGGDALDDGGLTDTGLTDKTRVGLDTSCEDTDGAPDLLLPADDGVELAEAGLLRHVDGVLGQVLQRGVGVCAAGVDLLVSSKDERLLLDGLDVDLCLLEQLLDGGVSKKCKEQVVLRDKRILLLLLDLGSLL